MYNTNFGIFARKYLCWSLFLINDTPTEFFFVNIVKFLRVLILKNI